MVNGPLLIFSYAYGACTLCIMYFHTSTAHALQSNKHFETLTCTFTKVKIREEYTFVCCRFILVRTSELLVRVVPIYL
jgi:hypothetical protein